MNETERRIAMINAIGLLGACKTLSKMIAAHDPDVGKNAKNHELSFTERLRDYRKELRGAEWKQSFDDAVKTMGPEYAEYAKLLQDVSDSNERGKTQIVDALFQRDKEGSHNV